MTTRLNLQKAFLVISILAIALFSISNVSAWNFDINSNTLELTQSNSSKQIEITNPNDFNITINIAGDLENLTISNNFNVSNGSTETITVSLTNQNNLLVNANYNLVFNATKSDDSSNVSDTTRSLVVNYKINPSLTFSFSPSISLDNNKTTLTIKNNGDVDLKNIDLELISNNLDLEFDIAPGSSRIDIGSLNISQEKTFELTSKKDLQRASIGSYSSQIRASTSYLNGGEKNFTGTLNFERPYCVYGSGTTDEHDIRIMGISLTPRGDWYPLEEIEVKVRIENMGKKRENVLIELALYDESIKDFIYLTEGDREYLELEIEVRGLDGTEYSSRRSDREEEVSFVFQIPVDSDLRRGDYTLYVKAYVDEIEQCFEDNRNIRLNFRDEFLVTDFSYSENTLCGQYHSVSFSVYNLDGRTYEDMMVRLVNSEFGIDISSEEFEIERGDYERINFEFFVPENASKGFHKVDIEVWYNPRNDDYRDSYKTSFFINVGGNCKYPTFADIWATLNSESVAGEEVIIKVFVVNNGTEKTSYTVSASNFDSWGRLISISPQQFELEGNGEKEVIIKLLPSEKVSGDKEFRILVRHGDTIDESLISFYIEEAEKSFISRITGRVSEAFSSEELGKGWFIWGLVIFNVLLVLLIIVVVVKTSKRSRRA